MRLIPWIALFFACGCLGDNQLSGSVDALFPLQVSQVDVLRSPEALQVVYLNNNGTAVDLVVQVSVYVQDLTLKRGTSIPLQGEYASGHQRTTVIHLASGEPVRAFAAVKHGDLVVNQGGEPGEMTRGSFSMSFYQGDDFAAGRSLTGNFDSVALDGGFGP